MKFDMPWQLFGTQMAGVKRDDGLYLAAVVNAHSRGFDAIVVEVRAASVSAICDSQRRHVIGEACRTAKQAKEICKSFATKWVKTGKSAAELCGCGSDDHEHDEGRDYHV